MSYEFSEEQEQKILDFIKWMKFFAITLFIFGLVSGFIAGLTGFDRLTIVIGFVLIVSSVLFYLPADNFTRIVNTEGNDIGELLRGFKELNRGMLFFLIGMFGLLVNSVIELIENLG